PWPLASPVRLAARQGPAPGAGRGPLSATEAGQFLGAATKMLTKAQWEWIAASRVLSRQRASIAVQEERLDRLLSNADQAMANAFTGGFRVAQTKLAISKVLPAESMASAALESAQIVALAILVREQMSQGEFSAHYRPFATVLPGPGDESAPATDSRTAWF